MSIICQACCGDGLHHPDDEVFEISYDDPCTECCGLGVTEDAGDPVNIKAITTKGHYESHDLPIYAGEGLDEFVELPVRFLATYYKGSYGAREAGGMQLEPDEPASWELDDFYIQINGEWYGFDPDLESSSPAGTAREKALELMED